MIRRSEECWIKRIWIEVVLLRGVEGEVLLIIEVLVKKDLIKLGWKWKEG